MEQPNKDRFDALMKLAEFTCGVREKRLAIEWKGTFSLWALMVGAIAYLKGQPAWALFLIFAALVVLHLWWIRINYVRNKRDAEQMYDFRKRAAQIVIPNWSDPGGKVPVWDLIWFQPMVTAFVGIVITLLAALATLPKYLAF